MLNRSAFLAATLALAVGTAATAAAAEMKLTTLEWPPYSGAALPGGGLSVKAAEAAASAAGVSLSHEVLPWQRAVQTGLNDDGYQGYFPEYKSPSLADTCLFSDSIGDSPLGLVERAEAPVTWTTLDDLAAYTIGTVKGYVNTAEFDAMAESGALTVEPAGDDLTNLRKVAAGRIDAAVIDRNVMDYLLANEPSLAGSAEALQFNEKLLENKTLHVCFRTDDTGRDALDRFNTGLAATR